jgi:hypothetical protein
MGESRQRVLGALRAQTNEYQSEWTSERALKTVVCAHGDLSPSEFEEAAYDLAQRQLVEYENGRYRLGPEAE